VTWGTNPDQVLAVDAAVPAARNERDRKTLAYIGLASGMHLGDVAIDIVFVGSCTNSRIEDLRAAATIAQGRRVAASVTAIVVPRSGLVKGQAEAEGLDAEFLAGASSRWEPGCSLCVAMNDDRLPAGARCASSSNRNFEGARRVGVRTHLMSPSTAAAAVTARITDIRALKAPA